jgi:N-acetylglucosaminyldiphosphoundecaprenol N-acetyl-beta-D-mannosaminyltransferase
MRKIVSILGIPIDDLDTSEVLTRLEEFVESGRFHQVATANVDFLIKAHEDPELMRILRMADLVVPDGMPLVWASRMMRNGLRERVTGADLVSPLAERAAKKGYRLFMLGGEPEVAQIAKARLESLHPNLMIVGCESPDVPSLVSTDCEPILRRIEEARPDILLVAFGNPKQEKFIHMYRQRLNVPVCMGVGGTFDFIAGKTKRAPRVVQSLGLEFLHRWTHNPRRLGSRYKQNLAQFPPLILRQVRSVHRTPSGAPLEVSTRNEGSNTILSVSGLLSGPTLDQLTEPVEDAFSAGNNVVLDMSRVRGTDGYSLGALQNLWKRAAWANCEIRIAHPPARIVKAFKATDSLGLFRFFANVQDALRAAPTVHFTTCVSAGSVGMNVAFCGAATVEYGARLELTLLEALHHPTPICLDLREVTFADCFALHAMRAFAENRNRRGLVTKSILSEAVGEAMHRAKLTSLTPEHPNS